MRERANEGPKQSIITSIEYSKLNNCLYALNELNELLIFKFDEDQTLERIECK